ncbi:MAG: cytochrome c biogenesis CcdA family protein [Candidatus Nanoarchaeia archaeon]
MKKLFLVGIGLLMFAGLVSAITLPPNLIKLVEHQEAVAKSITFLAAFLAGVISFTSPCGFVLFPMYFAYVFQERKKAMQMSALFSVGLLIGFVVVGLIAGFVGSFFNQYKLVSAVVAGILLILFGISVFFNKGFNLFNLKMDVRSKSGFGLIIFGFLFAFAWAPCSFAVLSGIFLLAGLSGSLMKASLMLFVFGLGVVVPFLLVSYFSDRFDLAKRVQGKVREFTLFNKKIVTTTYNLVASLLLIVLGVLTIMFQGTQFFQIYATTYVPESIDVAADLNKNFLSGFVASSIGNGVGIIVGVLILIVLIYLIRKK